MPQRSIPLSIVRGGTSKGIYLLASDLPPPGPERDATLLRLLGSPGDPIQIDGLGGSRNITSKVAIVGAPAHVESDPKKKGKVYDVEYTFAQVEPTDGKGVVSYGGNCGNISAGVGAFVLSSPALRALLPSPTQPDAFTTIRIFNTNTSCVLLSRQKVGSDGLAETVGDCKIPGVPGWGSEVLLDYKATEGAWTGRLLPTGNAVDHVELEGKTVPISIVDMANMCSFVRASDVGATGSETPDQIDANPTLLGRLVAIGDAAARLAGVPKAPLTFMISPSTDETAYDIGIRLLFMRNCHETCAGTAAICLSAAALTPGTLPAQLSTFSPSSGAEFRLKHPQGVMGIDIGKRADGEWDRVGMRRTARVLMQGTAFV